MATKFLTNLDLNQNQIINGRFEVVATDPTTGNFEGRLIYHSADDTIKVYTGSSWKTMVSGVSSTGTNTDAITINNNSDGTVTIQLNVADTDSAGLLSADFWNKLNDATSEATASKLVQRDANGQAKFGTPTDSSHAATKGYVDAARSGLDVKQSVKVATTGPITLSTGLDAGDEIDGYILVAGDRVLVKDQDTSSENGIYVVSESGAPARAPDADSSAEVTPGLFTFVERGTLNADSGWVLITDGVITLGTTGLEFSLFSVAGNILAGSGLSKTGDTLDVNVDGTSIEVSGDELRIASGAAGDGLSWDDGVLDVSVAANGGLQITSDSIEIKIDNTVSGLTTTADGLALDSSIAGTGITFTDGVLSRDTIDLTSDITGTLPIANGGTNATDEATARQNLAYTPPSGADTSTPVLARVASKVIGDGTNTSFTITHNFGTRAVFVQVFDSSTYDTVICDVVRTTIDSVIISFSVAPLSGAYTVVITG